MARIQRIRHTQQLLCALDGVVGATVRVGLGFQKVGSICPVNGGEIAAQHGATAHLQRHQSVGIGGRGLALHVNHIAVHPALQDGDAHAHHTAHKGVAFVTDNRLVGELLRSLGEGRRQHADKQRQSDKDSFHDLLVFDYSIIRL